MAGIRRRLLIVIERGERQYLHRLAPIRGTYFVEDEVAGIARVKTREIGVQLKRIGGGIQLRLMKEKFSLWIASGKIAHHDVAIVFAAGLAIADPISKTLKKRQRTLSAAIVSAITDNRI